MKNRINNLFFFFLWVIIILLFFSCAKEEVIPIAKTDEIATAQANDKAASAPEPDMTLAEALEVTNFNEHPDWRVAIKSFTCANRGQTLLVYNPNSPNLDFYQSDRFIVYWFRNGKRVRADKVRLDCVCKGNYTTVVHNRVPYSSVGIARHFVETYCLEENLSVANDIN